jgi:hypothetical protein
VNRFFVLLQIALPGKGFTTKFAQKFFLRFFSFDRLHFLRLGVVDALQVLDVRLAEDELLLAQLALVDGRAVLEVPRDVEVEAVLSRKTYREQLYKNYSLENKTGL